MKHRKTVTKWKQKIAQEKDLIIKSLRYYLPISTLHEISTDSWNAIFRGRGEEEEYCVKVMNEESNMTPWSLEDLDYIGEIMNGLRCAGFEHVLPPLLTRNGRYACRCGGYCLIVFPWCHAFDSARVTEKHIQPMDHVSIMAHLLYDLHVTGSSVALKTKPRETILPRAYSPWQWTSASEHLWNISERNLKEGNASMEAISNLQEVKKFSSTAIARFPEFFSSLPEEKTIVHGDFRPENILLHKDDFMLLYDFDMTHVGSCEEDVAYGSLVCSGPPWFYGNRDWTTCARFIRSYLECARGAGCTKIRLPYLEAAMYWVILKELSLSFKSTQVFGRYAIWKQLTEEIHEVLRICEW